MKRLLFKLFFRRSLRGLAERSSSIKSIFDKTITDLRTVNSDIQAEVRKTEKLEQILAAKKANLNNIHAKNDNLVQKIEALLA